MSIQIDPRDQKLYEAAFEPETARVFASLFALAKQQNARMIAEGKTGLFDLYRQSQKKEAV